MLFIPKIFLSKLHLLGIIPGRSWARALLYVKNLINTHIMTHII